MLTEHLLSKQGPLAHVWLAANYDRKLSKQQLLSTNITKTSRFITQSQELTTSNNSSQSQNHSEGAIILRLSGQLLLGIVRIYSRKTKYLLEDVNEILYKLKNSFRAVTTGASVTSASNSGTTGPLTSAILLPPQQTIINNVSQITLRDEVTDFDLLYQEDLDLEEDSKSGINAFDGRDTSHDSSVNDQSFNFDNSIEYPRSMGYHDDDNQDVDLDLDFDLDGNSDNDDERDVSIEYGRNAVATAQPDISTLSLNLKDMEDATDLAFDFDEPLETVQPVEQAQQVQSQEGEASSEAVPARPKRKLVGITEDGQLKTVKRRLVIDSIADVETGIPIQDLRAIQQEQLNINQQDYISIQLTEGEKIQLINELSEPVHNNKRRNLWEIDETLQRMCLDISEQEAGASPAESHLDFDNTLDFDLSLPDLESDNDVSTQNNDLLSTQLDGPEEITEENDFGEQNQTKSTIQVAEHLREKFVDGEDVVKLTDIIAKDLSLSDDPEKKPLGVLSDSDNRINERREATKCFFELLVLATNDCISIGQESEGKTEIGGNINIRSREKIFSNFL